MSLKNTNNRYGTITKLIHWGVAILILCQYYWVYWKRYMLPKNSPEAAYFIRNLHKPVGVTLLVLAVFFVAWRLFNKKPSYPASMPAWEKMLAALVHFLLYICMLLMPISGILMSTYGGYKISMFGYYDLPLFLAKNKALGNLWYEIHEYTSFVLIGLFVVHVAASLKHHFQEKDNILKRMLPFG